MTPLDVLTAVIVLASAGYLLFRSLRKSAGGCHGCGGCHDRTAPEELVQVRRPPP